MNDAFVLDFERAKVRPFLGKKHEKRKFETRLLLEACNSVLLKNGVKRVFGRAFYEGSVERSAESI